MLLAPCGVLHPTHKRRGVNAGGFGTLEEALEMITWHQLGFHSKPVGLLNINGFYDKLLEFFDHCVSQVGRVSSEYEPQGALMRA